MATYPSGVVNGMMWLERGTRARAWVYRASKCEVAVSEGRMRGEMLASSEPGVTAGVPMLL
jgi:hypothetical protein